MNLGSCKEFLYMYTSSALKTQRAYLWILSGIVKIRPWNNQDLIMIESNFYTLVMHLILKKNPKITYND